MRRPLFRGLLVLATTAAAAALTVPAAIPASAASALQLPGYGTSARSASLALPGGLRAVRVPRSRTAAKAPDFSFPWEYDESTLLENSQDSYDITLQPSSYSGRLANHLYMWANNDWNTQIWDVYQYNGGGIYLFVSEYNGLCINVPGVSTSSVQLIVYSCSGGSVAGVPKNEVFDGYTGSSSPKGTVFTPSYDYDLAIGIGSNFPGNGAWVITYGRNFSNYEENWAFELSTA
jgi:hypothetical protein